MRQLDVFKKLTTQEHKLLYINTATSLDISTGAFQEGKAEYKNFKTQRFLNGGISPTLAVIGKSQTYKSTITLSYLSRALRLYKDSSALVYDTEFAIGGKDRILDLGKELDNYHDTDIDEVKDRLILKDKSALSMEEFYDLIHKISEERQKYKKDYLVESPFIDRKTGKKIKTLIPCFIVIDSFSLMQSSNEKKLFEKHKLSDSETNMVYMQDGNIKSKFMRQLPSLSYCGGLHILLTAHVGKKFELNPYGDKSKELQYMKNTSTIKNVGSQFGFLVNTLLESSNTKLVLDGNKQCFYPSDIKTPPSELNTVSLMICRCKNNVSGLITNPVISQYNGIQNGITNFDFLKKIDFGLDGNNIRKRLQLYKDIDITRQKLRPNLNKNYEFYRALEIISQLGFIYNYWLLNDPVFKILMEKKPEEIVELLIANKSIKISDILNSRGHWTYDKSDKRAYLSILDILELLNKP